VDMLLSDWIRRVPGAVIGLWTRLAPRREPSDRLSLSLSLGLASICVKSPCARKSPSTAVAHLFTASMIARAVRRLVRSGEYLRTPGQALRERPWNPGPSFESVVLP
jgi:hypothetical protein